MAAPGPWTTGIVAAASLGWAAWVLWRMKEDQAYFPLLIFFVSYIGFFYIGALGMQLDAKGYFDDWLSSIGVQEAYLDSAQSWVHLIGIHLPFWGLGLGALVASRTASPWLDACLRLLRARPATTLIVLGGALGLGVAAGSFAMTLALLLIVVAGLLGPGTAADGPSAPGRWPIGWLMCFLATWCIAASVLASHDALGSLFTYATHFSLQEEIGRMRSDLALGLPVFYWPLSYSVLPTLSAACLWEIHGRGPWRNLVRVILVVATLWIVFAHFFKGVAFYYLFYLAFCVGIVHPKRSIKIGSAVAVSAFLLIGAFYGYLQVSAGQPLDLLKIAQQFFYRLGTNQYFYVLYFPGKHPWLPLDLGHLGNMDNRLVFLFQYPVLVNVADGTLAGPYISNAYAQGGNLCVLVYSLLAGWMLQTLWVLGQRQPGSLRVVMLGRVLFMAFMLSQLSFRDTLGSGWGIIWGLFPILLLKWLPARRHDLAEA